MYTPAQLRTHRRYCCRCRNRGENLYRYAVKELLLSATPHGINSITEVLQEVEVMQALLQAGTCHVVKLHAFYRSQDTAWLVLEYVFLQLHVRLNF